MNLYFLDKEDKQHLIAADVREEEAINVMLADLAQRHPEVKSYYQRYWWDNYHRMWIDYGSHIEFYILQEEKYALNVVEDAAAQEEKYVLDVAEDAAVQEENQDEITNDDGAVMDMDSYNHCNKDYCDF